MKCKYECVQAVAAYTHILYELKDSLCCYRHKIHSKKKSNSKQDSQATQPVSTEPQSQMHNKSQFFPSSFRGTDCLPHNSKTERNYSVRKGEKFKENKYNKRH